MYHGSYEGVLRVLHIRVLNGFYIGVSIMLQVCFNSVTRVTGQELQLKSDVLQIFMTT